MRRLLALLLAFVLAAPALAEAYPTIDHSLQEIPVLQEERAIPRSLDNFLVRDWNATDLSIYKSNGTLTLEVRGRGSFAVGIGEILKGQHVTETVTLTLDAADWTTLTIPLSDFKADMKHVCTVPLGRAVGDVSIRRLAISSPDGERAYPLFKVNQVGYLPDGAKTAIVSGYGDMLPCRAGDAFEVVDAASETVVYEGALTLKTGLDASYSGEAMLTADFTPVAAAGMYYLRLKALPQETSPAFLIGTEVYDLVLRDATRYYYYQRSNMAVEEEYGEGFTRPDLSPVDFSLPLMEDPTVRLDVSGGWHDAGEIGKYVIPGAVALNSLLWAYKLYPNAFGDANNIPESGNGIPDLLDEAKWELDFILKMQDETTGGFYMKTKATLDNDPPESRVVWPATANTSAVCAAILSFASTIYRDIDPEYADTMLAAAERGWQFAQANPNLFLDTPYGGKNNPHTSLWAAGALFYATGKKEYGAYFKQEHMRYLGVFSERVIGSSVDDMAPYGYFCYLMAEGADPGAVRRITTRVNLWIKNVLACAEENPWNVAIRPDTFWWGSFNIILGVPMDMLAACHATGQDPTRAQQLAADAVHFILGENPMRKTFVTGHGADGISCTFSNFWGNRPEGFPKGYMPGGMNSFDGKWISRFPMKCYSDDAHDWVTNENAVYWNAVLVFALASQAR